MDFFGHPFSLYSQEYIYFLGYQLIRPQKCPLEVFNRGEAQCAPPPPSKVIKLDPVQCRVYEKKIQLISVFWTPSTIFSALFGFIHAGQHVHSTPQKAFLEAYSTRCP